MTYHTRPLADLTGGRDGHPIDLSARVRVSQKPNEPDEWAPIDVSHPVEKARLRFVEKGVSWLGRDEREVDRRYRAARVWQGLYLTASGQMSGGTLYGERVDGRGDGEMGQLIQLQAGIDRVRIVHGRRETGEEPARGMTVRRQHDLDAVCGEGAGLSQHARAMGLHRSSVIESVIAGLDAVAGYAPWSARLERVQVLMIRPVVRASRPVTNRKGKRR
ncbi:hypothetical protein E5163_14845 [Marinicauda algicola]|uniref:Uncharacterized protein n=1 Tax=Marinicauda algicola TaxID=2029849 RepID=A0A4S2GWF2_9PROT|nr:hypothetical protein [Marinicauda algicola]TGY87343.1 hypothetical protein E5163_14845 [Marinicauda algicola]